jgi:hypothetical protein
MKQTFTLIFFCASLLGFAQPVNKFINEESVTRVIKALAADEMMGRSATRPEHIDKAAAFIADEFKTMGLTPLQGLKTFRQGFKKDMIVPQTLEVTINNQKIPTETRYWLLRTPP